MTVTMTVQQIISVLSLYWSVTGCNRCIPMYRCPCQDFAVEVDPEAKFSDSKSACSTSSTFSTFSTFAHVSSHVSLVFFGHFQAKQLVLRMPEEASLQAQKVRKVLVERVDISRQHSLIRKFSAEAQKETRLLRTLQFLCDNYRL